MADNSPPNVGPDFATLAQIAQPQMTGNVPLGGMWQASMFNQDRQRFSNLMSSATEQAGLQASVRGQAAGEYMSGAPGREAGIQTSNAMQQGALSNVPQALSAQADTAATGAINAHQAKVEAEQNKILPYAKSWMSATTPEKRNQVKEQMHADGVSQIGAHNINELPDSVMDGIMSETWDRAIHTVPQEQKIAQIKASGDAWVQRVEATGDYKERIAAQQAEVAMARINAVKEAAEKKGMNMSQWEASMKDKEGKGTLTPQEAISYYNFKADKIAVAQAMAGNKGPQINTPALNPTQDGQPKPPLFVPPAVPKPMPVTGIRKEDSLDPVSKTATIGGKSVGILGYDPNTKEYLLADKSVVKKDDTGAIVVTRQAPK